MAGRQRRSGTGAAWLGLVREGEQSGRVEHPLAKQKGRGELGRRGGVEEGIGGACAACGGVLAERP